MNRRSKLIILSVIAIISACNSDSSDSNKTDEDNNVVLLSSTKFDYIEGNKDTAIDLSHILPSTNSGQLVVSDKSTKQKCKYDVVADKFHVLLPKGKACFYKYTLTNEGNSNIGYGAVAAIPTDKVDSTNMLPPLSETLDLGTDYIDIDIQSLLSSEDIMDGSYELQDSVLVTENMDAYVSILEEPEPEDDSDHIRDTVRFVHAGGIGTYQILYSFVNTKTTDVRLGIIYVSVSDEANTSPTSESVSISELPIKTSITFGTESSLSEDIYTLPVNDFDSDSISFVDVVSLDNLITEIKDKTFSVEAEKKMFSEIFYSVRDGRGGFSQNVIKVLFDGSMDGLRYPKLKSNSTKYHFPENNIEATANGRPPADERYTEELDPTVDAGSNGVNYPLYSISKAQSICKIQGLELATPKRMMQLYEAYEPFGGIKKQLNDILDGEGNVKLTGTGGWPIGASYVVYDDEDIGQIGLYDMLSGSFTPTESGHGLVSCTSTYATDIAITESYIGNIEPRQLHVVGFAADGTPVSSPEISSWKLSNLSGEGIISESGILTPLKEGYVEVTAISESGLTTKKQILIAENILRYNPNRCWLDKNNNKEFDGDSELISDCFLKTKDKRIEKKLNPLELAYATSFERVIKDECSDVDEDGYLDCVPKQHNFLYTKHHGVDINSGGGVSDIDKVTANMEKIAQIPFGSVSPDYAIGDPLYIADIATNTSQVSTYSGNGMGFTRLAYDGNLALPYGRAKTLNITSCLKGDLSSFCSMYGGTEGKADKYERIAEIPYIFSDYGIDQSSPDLNKNNIKIPRLIISMAINFQEFSSITECSTAQLVGKVLLRGYRLNIFGDIYSLNSDILFYFTKKDNVLKFERIEAPDRELSKGVLVLNDEITQTINPDNKWVELSIPFYPHYNLVENSLLDEEHLEANRLSVSILVHEAEEEVNPYFCGTSKLSGKVISLAVDEFAVFSDKENSLTPEEIDDLF